MICVLGDGDPTLGRETHPDGILRWVRRVNVWRRIVIHTVQVGDEFESSILPDLARQNRGRLAELK